MSRKYIRQQIIQDFVYPNNDVPQYDVDNVVHEINGNSVSGTINSLNTVSISSTGITLTLNYTWNLNNAEPFINNANLLGLVSVHALPPSQQYYKPWRLVQSTTNANTNITTITQSTSFTITPSMFGLSVFTNGKYYFEVRFIGHRSVYPVCTNLDITIPIVTPTPTPTSTPTPTPGGPTPTPTPTPGGPTPTPTPTPTISPTPDTSGTLYVYARYAETTSTIVYSKNGGPETTIGIPFSTSCTYIATITGVSDLDNFTFYSPFSYSIAGSTTSCPANASGCTYYYTFTGSGSNFVYLTINASNAC